MNTAERLIKEAMSLAGDYLPGSETPSHAVAKAASEKSLSPDMTDRLVEGFNIALINSTIKNASDKTASFPIADKSKVAELVFDVFDAGTKKSASVEEIEDKPEVGFCINLVPSDLSLTQGKKVARITPEDNLVPLYHGAHSVIEEEHQKIASAKVDRLQAERDVETKFQNLVEVMESSDFLGKFASLEMRALSEYGDTVRPVLDNLFSLCKLDELGESRFEGSVKIAAAYFPPMKEYDLLVELMDSSESFVKVATEIDTQIVESIKRIGELQHDLNLACGTKSASRSASDLVDGHVFKFAAGPSGGDKDKGGGSKLGLPKLPDSPFKEKGIIPSTAEGVSKSLADDYAKAHSLATESFYKGNKGEVDEEVNNIRRQKILMDLMADDDIIATMEPGSIQNAYNVLLGISPELSLQPAIVQAWLRNAGSSQAVDPFAAKQLVELDQGLMKSRAMRGNPELAIKGK